MSYSEEDPEVAADARARAFPSRQALTDEQFAQRIREVAAPKVIDRVPCRARCRSVVDWTEEAEHAFETFNRKLERDGDERGDRAPLDRTRIAFCSACIAKGRAMTAANNRKYVDALAEKIREIKQSSDPMGETGLIEQIKKLNHPDVPGLLSALTEAINKAPTSRRVRTSDVLR
jgi:hypothetical protein